MTNIRKGLTFLLTLTMLLSVLCIGVAAVDATPGQSVTVTIAIDDVYGVDGKISYSNKALFSSFSIEKLSSNDGMVSESKAYLYGLEKGQYGFVIKATVSSSAKPGDSCTISFDYRKTIDDNGTNVPGGVVSQKVVVVAPETEPPVTQPPVTQPPVTQPPVTQPPVTQTPVTQTPVTQRPVTPTPKPPVSDPLDYTDIKANIGIAEALKKDGSTNASWDALQVALAEAQDAVNSAKTQKELDDAAAKLEEAIDGLVKVDYSKLEEALDNAKKLAEDEKVVARIEELLAEISRGTALLTSGDQAEVDKAAKDIQSAIDEIVKILADMGEIVEVEVPGDCEHGDGLYCNIPIHKLWPILFIISAVLNVGLIIFIIIYIRRQKDEDEEEKKANAKK